jgi:hypothetical protein
MIPQEMPRYGEPRAYNPLPITEEKRGPAYWSVKDKE